jgi:hypothetical protein
MERALAVGIGVASVAEIDDINILQATMLAMRRATEALALAPVQAFVDGNRAPTLACPVETIIDGDAKSMSIAAASIIAKVTRDRVMRRCAEHRQCRTGDQRWRRPTFRPRCITAEALPRRAIEIAVRGLSPILAQNQSEGNDADLLGVAVVIVGFALRFNPLLVVVASALVTGLAAGMAPEEVLAAFGKAFNENRFVSVAWLVLPAIGVLERAGLQERARTLISGIRAVTVGRLLIVYMLLRQLTAAVGLISIAGLRKP